MTLKNKLLLQDLLSEAIDDGVLKIYEEKEEDVLRSNDATELVSSLREYRKRLGQASTRDSKYYRLRKVCITEAANYADFLVKKILNNGGEKAGYLNGG